jgi:hypothetical protein
MVPVEHERDESPVATKADLIAWKWSIIRWTVSALILSKLLSVLLNECAG